MAPRYVYMSAVTGHYVTEEYALANPKTTVRYRLVHDPVKVPDFEKLFKALASYQKPR